MRLLSSRLAAPGNAAPELEGPKPSATLDQKMRSLLDRALDQSTGGGQSESILRPVFKDDEPLMISVGAVLGGIVGEIQVQVIERFAH